MKRLLRDPMKFDALDLFAKYAAEKGLRFSRHAVQSFAKDIRLSVRGSIDKPTLVHGRRTEAMFEMIVASLGGVALIKHEDEGEVYVDPKLEILVPDYRLVPLGRREILVEIKNHHPDDALDDYVLREKDLDRLRAYADLVHRDLFFGVFWSRWNVWTLTRPRIFKAAGKKYRLSFEAAMRENEMSIIGDKKLGTRVPIRFRVEFEEVERQGDVRRAVIKQVSLLSEDRVLTDPREIRIATQLMLYGDWTEQDPITTFDAEGRIISWEVPHAPQEAATNEQSTNGFAFVATYSAMLSRMFRNVTATRKRLSAAGIRAPFKPGSMKEFVPDDYFFHPRQLPLWVFEMVPASKRSRR